MDEILYPADLVVQLDRQLMDAFDDPAGWQDSPVVKGHRLVEADTRTLTHANGARLRFGKMDKPNAPTTCEAWLACASVECRDGQGVVVVRPGWSPFGSPEWSNVLEVPLDQLMATIHKHVSTPARAQQRWGQNALRLALHHHVPGAIGDWIVKTPGVVAGQAEAGITAFLRSAHFDTQTVAELREIAQSHFRFTFDTSIQACLPMHPDMEAAVTAMGGLASVMLRIERRNGLSIGFKPYKGITVEMEATGHERLHRLHAAQEYLDREPTCPPLWP